MSLRTLYFAILAVLTTITALEARRRLEIVVEGPLICRCWICPRGRRHGGALGVCRDRGRLCHAGADWANSRGYSDHTAHDRALQEEVTRLSQEDHLTGLLNRRRTTQLLDDEVRRALRYDSTFAIILMDVDDFKAINDRFGHQAGDTVLKKIADVIQKGVRATDIIGRWGGEEFLILSPETDVAGGISLAEKMRTLLEAADFAEIGGMTASFGVAAFDQSDDIEAVIGRADAGLYAAKNGGKNRTEVAQTNDQIESASSAYA